MTTAALTILPPLRQSSAELLGCEYSYALQFIAGLKPPSTPPAVRGTEIHEALAAYAQHCAAKRIKSDYAFLDVLRATVGAEAAGILETCRDSIVIDFQNFFAAEVYMGLDEDFQPTYSTNHDGAKVPFREDLFGKISTAYPPAYAGILDAIYLYPGGKAAKIIDFKSHPRPFDPTTFQGKEYALFLFQHLPELQEIEFVLQFVRFPNIHRPVKYLRSDVPEMIEECKRVRAHQKAVHEKVLNVALDTGCTVAKASDVSNLIVHAGKQCVYCPAILNNSCPLAEMNPMSNMSPADRLNFRLWIDAANRKNNQVMKDYVDGTGNTITSKDANGKGYSFGPTVSKSTTYPLFQYSPGAGFELNPLIDKILDWVTSVLPEDGRPTKKGLPPWPARLRIGATELTAPLKAGIRADLHQWVQDTPGVVVVEDDVKLKLERAPELDDGSGEEYRTYGKGEES